MKLKSILLFLSLLFSVSSFSQQASLTIVNNSQRSMSVKVMRGSSGKGQLHEKVTIYANSSETVYFSQSGNYFTKTKATINGRDPICRKGKPFKVAITAVMRKLLIRANSVLKRGVSYQVRGTLPPRLKKVA